MKILCLKNEVSKITFESLYEILLKAEEKRQKIRESIKILKSNQEKQKERIILRCFDMMSIILDLPFDRSKFQVKGFEIMGDIFEHFKDYMKSILYYIKGVIYNLNIESTC